MAMSRSSETLLVSDPPDDSRPMARQTTNFNSNVYWKNPSDLLRAGDVVLDDMLMEETFPFPPVTGETFPTVNRETFPPGSDETFPLGLEERIPPSSDETFPNLAGCTKGQTRKRKKRGFKAQKKLGNLSKYSKREVEREIARNAKKFNDKIQIENLKTSLGNPWDGVSLQEKKHFALHFYYTHLQVYFNSNSIQCD